jgi:hypothetical protein
MELQQTSYRSSFSFFQVVKLRLQSVCYSQNGVECRALQFKSPAVVVQPEYIFGNIPFTPNPLHPCIFSLCLYPPPLLLTSPCYQPSYSQNLHTLTAFGLPGHLNKRFANSAPGFEMRAYYYACSSKGVGVWY